MHWYSKKGGLLRRFKVQIEDIDIVVNIHSGTRYPVFPVETRLILIYDCGTTEEYSYIGKFLPYDYSFIHKLQIKKGENEITVENTVFKLDKAYHDEEILYKFPPEHTCCMCQKPSTHKTVFGEGKSNWKYFQFECGHNLSCCDKCFITECLYCE